MVNLLNASTDVFVKSYTQLKDRPHADHALTFLQRVASLVKPIMRKHGWVLPTLGEFFPKDDHLVGLNINSGRKILLRLRPYSAPDSFYDEEQVVLVMLHELTHNVRAPHDVKFYQFLAGLEEEYYELKRTGYAGEGFFSAGHTLGGSSGRQKVPPHRMQERALEAAERRRAVNLILSGGGETLGGSSSSNSKNKIIAGRTAGELAAEAAQRRNADKKTCEVSEADAEREAKRAAEDSIESKVIDLTEDSSDDDDEIIIVDGPYIPPKSKRPSSKSTRSKPSTSVDTRHRPYSPQNRLQRPPPSLSTSHWDCPACTLLNSSLKLQCTACFAVRPQRVNDEGWTCVSCGQSPIIHEFWSCTRCGSIKTES